MVLKNSLKLKKSFQAASRYKKEFLLYSFSVILIILIFDGFSFTSILLTCIVFLLSLFHFYFIGKKRSGDIALIKDVFSNITKHTYKNSSEITLNEGLTDIETEIKLMYDKIQADIEMLVKLERVRKEFLGNVSHELKTPIFAISGYIETLLDGAIKDEKVSGHFLKRAYEHTENLNSLVEDLIGISMIESGEMKLSKRYFNLKAFIEEIIYEFSDMASNKSITLSAGEIRKGLQVYGDKSRLKQVFTNLLQNALKYTNQGSVEILVEEEDNLVNIRIKDTGIGISEEDIPRIFERFYRVDKARSREVGGTGLGLAIVKHLLEAHESKVGVVSKLNEGSEFFFILKKSIF
ncbi:MAG: ATP-binding protein [Ignavibacteriaceae bacterium]|nr:ATP-binding protein [Ignavibacteriaceae bacterium]